MGSVRPATTADVPTVGRVLAAAFADDPVWRWMSSPRADWDRRAASWFEAEAKAQIAGHGEVLIDEQERGAAVWSPPKRWKSTSTEALALLVPSVRLFGRNLAKAAQALAAMEKVHPLAEHWYLAILGTDPAHQGQGVGSALIRAVTDRCDEQGLPSYLESSKERNVPFYARHGFEVRDVLERPGTPTMWTMWREPRG